MNLKPCTGIRFYINLDFKCPDRGRTFRVLYKDVVCAVSVVDAKNLVKIPYWGKSAQSILPDNPEDWERIKKKLAERTDAKLIFNAHDPFDGGYEISSTGGIIDVSIPKNYVEKNDMEIGRLCFEVFRYFHSVFRLELSAGFNESMSVNAPSPVLFIESDIDFDSCEFPKIKCGQYTDKVEFVSPIKMYDKKNSLTEEDFFKLNKRLSVYLPIKPHEGILIAALQQFYSSNEKKPVPFNNVSLSAVLCCTAMEVFVQNILVDLEYFDLPKNSNGKISANHAKEIQEYSQKIYETPLKQLIENYLDKKFQVSITKSAEYDLWDKKSCGLRNRIIHRAEVLHSPVELQQSFTATNNLIDYIKSALPKRFLEAWEKHAPLYKQEEYEN